MKQQCKYESNRDSLRLFVNSLSLEEEEKKRIIESTHDTVFKRRLFVCGTLIIWSLIAAWGDAVLLPGVIIYVIAKDYPAYWSIAFPVAYFILNGLLKFLYVKRELKEGVSTKEALISCFPYVGSIVLLKPWLIDDKLFRTTILGYLKHRKGQFVEKLLAKVRIKKA